MSKVVRADFAATTPWDGIIGRPADGTSVTDIGQLTGSGFFNKQVPVWNVALQKFVPANITGIAGYSAPSPGGSSNPYIDPVQVEWDVPALSPLQSIYEDFPLIGAIPATPAAVGVPFDMQFCWIRADVIANDSIRLTVTNLNASIVDLGLGLYNVQLFQLA
jgi:hypothetical protein